MTGFIFFCLGRICFLGLHNLQDYIPGREGGGGILPYKRVMMCRWMGSHFHDWCDYNGVAFSIDLLEWGCKFSDFRVSRNSKWEDSRLKNQKIVVY